MKILIPLILVVTLNAGATMPRDFEIYRNKSRLLVVLAASPTQAGLEKLRTEFKIQARNIVERDLVVLEETSMGPWHHDLNACEKLTTVLIGKDGGEKWRHEGPVNLDEVFKEIDAMPMRQDEMRTGK